jgi:hypothetical protein
MNVGLMLRKTMLNLEDLKNIGTVNDEKLEQLKPYINFE